MANFNFPANLRILDLSETISVNTKIYPGDPVPQLSELSTIERTGARTTLLSVGTHVGTHVDTPSHVLVGERTVDELSLYAFCGPAWVFGVQATGHGPAVTVADLDTGAPLNEGEIALIYTGSSDEGAPVTSHEHAYLAESAADWLVARRVKAVGIDSLSVDRYDSKDLGAHRKLLSKNIVLFENLSSNLRLLVGKHIFFFAMPLKLKGSEASPVRAFAVY